jgi:hypothetical protein
MTLANHCMHNCLQDRCKQNKTTQASTYAGKGPCKACNCCNNIHVASASHCRITTSIFAAAATAVAHPPLPPFAAFSLASVLLCNQTLHSRLAHPYTRCTAAHNAEARPYTCSASQHCFTCGAWRLLPPRGRSRVRPCSTQSGVSSLLYMRGVAPAATTWS